MILVLLNQSNLKNLNLIFKSWLIKFNISFHTTRVQLSDYSSPAYSFVSGSASTSFSFMSSISFFPFIPCAWSSVFFLTPQLHIFGGGIKYLIWLIKIYISNSIYLIWLIYQNSAITYHRIEWIQWKHKSSINLGSLSFVFTKQFHLNERIQERSSSEFLSPDQACISSGYTRSYNIDY